MIQCMSLTKHSENQNEQEKWKYELNDQDNVSCNCQVLEIDSVCLSTASTTSGSGKQPRTCPS